MRPNRLALLRVAVAYRWRHGRWPDLTNPRRFTEWVQWRKLNDRDPGLARLTDKLAGKQFAADRLGEAAITPTLWSGTVLPPDPPWPKPFVVKANHGCNQWIVVRSEADWARARRLAPRWLRSIYGAWLDEWHYRAARPLLLVEPFVGPGGELPVDYKVYVFGGRAEAVQVHLGRARAHRWMQFDRSWRRLSSDDGLPSPPPPRSLAAMLDAGERLGSGRDHLRIDFYEIEGRVRFGEFCLFPGSGLDPFDPPSLDHDLGGLWAASRQPVALAAPTARGPALSPA